MLVFGLAGQRYGLPLESVREVLRAVWVSPLPSAPPIVEGVINLRGRPVPVLNLRRRLGVPVPELHPSEHLIVSEISGRAVAFRVDRVDAIAAVPSDAVSSAAQLGPGVRQVDRIASDGGGVVFVHDPAAFLTAAEASELAGALETGAAVTPTTAG